MVYPRNLIHHHSTVAGIAVINSSSVLSFYLKQKDNNMAIKRVSVTEEYTLINNKYLKDEKLSLKAKGLLCLMISLPNGWDFSLSNLVALSNDGSYATSSALKELEKNGYLFRQPIKNKGRFIDWEYVLLSTQEK